MLLAQGLAALRDHLMVASVFGDFTLRQSDLLSISLQCNALFARALHTNFYNNKTTPDPACFFLFVLILMLLLHPLLILMEF